jgi:hypothetical protein
MNAVQEDVQVSATSPADLLMKPLAVLGDNY